MSVIKLTDLDLKGKRVLIRADLNVPVKDGKVTSDARISASMATFEHCLKAGAKVMVMSHLGRPTEGEYSEENSLKPVADVLSQKLGKPVRLIKDWINGGFEVAAGELVLLENVRFNKGEKKNVARPRKRQAVRRVRDGCVRHRAPRRESTTSPSCAVACAGILLTQELDALTKACSTRSGRWSPSSAGFQPNYRARIVERSIRWWSAVASPAPSGRIGKKIGKCSPRSISFRPRRCSWKMTKRGATIPIAVDVVVGKFDANEPAVQKNASDVTDDDMISTSVEERATTGRHYYESRHGGVERPDRRVRVRPVGAGTKTVPWPSPTQRPSRSPVAATTHRRQKYDIFDKVSYISTAGGAFLESSVKTAGGGYSRTALRIILSATDERRYKQM